jgi:hypothetical protein
VIFKRQQTLKNRFLKPGKLLIKREQFFYRRSLIQQLASPAEPDFAETLAGMDRTRSDSS